MKIKLLLLAGLMSCLGSLQVPAVEITASLLPDGQVDVGYSARIVTSGGIPFYIYGVSGYLPDGLSLNSATGEISGTPTREGTFSFTVSVADFRSLTPQIGTKGFSITIAPSLEITASSLPDGQLDVDYSARLFTTGGILPYTWSIVSGSLPDGLSLNSATGEISGTPTSEGSFSFTVRATDSGSPTQSNTQSLTITIASALEITTSSLPNGRIDVDYSARLFTTGGISPYIWAVVSGSLPEGLSLDSLTGEISGTPTREGTFSFTLRVTDSGSPTCQSSTKELSITIASTLEITTSLLPQGQVDVDYSAKLSTTGGRPPYTWSVVLSSLPEGLSLDVATGEISGTPTREGTFSFTLRVTDSGSPTCQSKTQLLSITIRTALIQKLAKSFDSRVELLTSGIVQQPILDSFLNMNNNFGINRYQVELELRADMNLKFRQIELGFKPRGKFNWKRWEDGLRKGEVQDDQDLFINEWLANYMLRENLFISYGRENLQWGPSYLCSPSNPFGSDKGRGNPKQELSGSDFAQILWMPDYRWNLLLMANTDKGRRESPFSDFKKTYALKVDYTGLRKYFSLIASHRESDYLSRFGFFGNWTASEALLVYGEGSFLEKESNPKLLAGASYTLEVGPTITIEYFYNEGGNKEDPIHLCFPPSDPTDVFFRQNYLLVQYGDTCLEDRMYTTLRWTLNLDDASDILGGIVEYDLGDNAQLFAVGNFNVGEKDSEFGSVLSYSVMVGVTFSD